MDIKVRDVILMIFGVFASFLGVVLFVSSFMMLLVEIKMDYLLIVFLLSSISVFIGFNLLNLIFKYVDKKSN